MKTVKEYAELLGYPEDKVLTITLERMKELENNIMFLQNLLPIKGKLFVVKNNCEEELVLQYETDMFKELAKINYQRLALITRLTK